MPLTVGARIPASGARVNRRPEKVVQGRSLIRESMTQLPMSHGEHADSVRDVNPRFVKKF